MAKTKLRKAKTRVLASLFLLTTAATLYMIYIITLWENIENLLRFIVVIMLLLFLALIFALSLRVFFHGKKKLFFFLVVGQIIYIILLVFLAFNVHRIYSALFQVTSNTVIYSSSIVTINSPAETIDDLTDGKIGIYDSERSIAGYEIPKEVIAERNLTNEIVYLGSYTELLLKLDEEEIAYAFLPTDYPMMFSELEDFSEIIEATRIIFTQEKEVAITREGRQFNLEEPMTFLLMGIDSTADDISRGSYNGDALMVVTFNPKTLHVTMLSIPRDIYVPIACFDGERKNKITHAAWYGDDCIIETIENFLEIDIDHLVKMNFRGLVNMVDAVGGIEVDVPYSFCEQDSRSRWGEHTVFVKEGVQHLDGEQALALTRNRKNNTARCGYGVNWANDFVRGENQQLVLRALLEEFKKIRELSKVQNLLEELATTTETSLQTNEILSFYNVFRDIIIQTRVDSIEDIMTIQRLAISGYDRYIYDYHPPTGRGMRSTLYNFVPYQASIEDVREVMMINLGLKEAPKLEAFSFNVNEPYEEKIIGRGTYNEPAIELLPEFKTRQQAENYAKQHNLRIEVNEVENNGQYSNSQIISQYPNPQTNLEYVDKIVLNIAAEKEEKSLDCLIEPEQENCLFPDLVGRGYEAYRAIRQKHNLNWIEQEISEGDAEYDEAKAGLVVEQNIAPGIDIYELADQEIIITYMAKKIEDEIEDEPEDETEEA